MCSIAIKYKCIYTWLGCEQENNFAPEGKLKNNTINGTDLHTQNDEISVEYVDVFIYDKVFVLDWLLGFFLFSGLLFCAIYRE